MSIDYSVAIRTLGTAGEKYQQLLDSLMTQSILPQKIVVYIAEGYAIPKETVGVEQYVFVRKGMLAQRALSYEEISSEYILFLDDDLKLSPKFVETLCRQLQENGGDVISPDILSNTGRSSLTRTMMFLSARMRPRYNDKSWGYKVMMNGAYSYNNAPLPVMRSQTNAGACFLCRKSDFLKLDLEEESWLDAMPYALGDDQAMFYKMHLRGLKVLTSYNADVIHLDAGSAGRARNKETANAYCDAYFKSVFWCRFVFACQKSFYGRAVALVSYAYTFVFNLTVSLARMDSDVWKAKRNGYRDAWRFINSDEFRSLKRVC